MLFNIEKEDLNKKINSASWIYAMYKNMIELCKPLMENERPYVIVGDGIKGSAARAYGAKMTMLITAGMITEDRTYTEKAKDMLLYAAENVDVEYYKNANGHLAVADAAFSYAICYDLMENEYSNEEKNVIKNAMEELGEFLYTCGTVWGLRHSGVTSCNHNSVHHASLGLCGMILKNDKWLELALERVKAYFGCFADKTGYVTEGVSYTYYGLTNALVFCDAYYNLTGIDLVGDYENIKEIPNQFVEQMLPRYDALLPLNDHDGNTGDSAPFIYLVSRFGNCEALYLWRMMEEGNKTFGSGSGERFMNGIAFPFIISWANPTLPSIKPSDMNRPLSKKFECGRVMMRTAWDDEKATFVSFTSGKDFHRGHNHPDQNSFTAYAFGEEFLIDPGVWACDSKSHNIVMANNIGQYKGCSRGEIISFKDYGRYVYVAGDATEAYEWCDDLLIGYAVRQMIFVRKPYPMLIIRDDIQNETDGENLYEFMLHTTVTNEMYEKDGVLFIKGSNFGNLCRVNMVYPYNAELEIYEKVERDATHYNRTYSLSDYHKEACFKTKALTPYFTAVITFGEKEEDMPNISCVKKDGTMIISAEFKDGYTEEFEIKKYEMSAK
ncbi:MAG: hypothetical protein IJD36_04820 [Clostridia bacterium]|nr:hypothetical protein [Clostridia bacterium]